MSQREPIDFAQLCDVNDDFRMRLATVSEGFCPYCHEPLELAGRIQWPVLPTVPVVDVEGGKCPCCLAMYASIDDGEHGPGYVSTGGFMCEHIQQLIREGIRGVD
jgi:hypothetical protein